MKSQNKMILWVLAVAVGAGIPSPAVASHAFTPTAAFVTAPGGDPDIFCCVGGGEYHSASVSVFIDPANTKWISWNGSPDVDVPYPTCYLGYCLGGNDFGTDDFIVLTVTNPLGASSQATIDHNDSFSFAIGPQQIIYGMADDAPDVMRGGNWGCYPNCIEILNEAGAFDSTIFNAVGTYTFHFSFRDGPCCGHGHGNIWLLVQPVLKTIDIKPGSFPNSINPRSKGRIPVAIITTDTFDAGTVDPATILFGPTGSEVASPVHSALEDVDEDGDIDMILHFKTQDTGIQCGDNSASLMGEISGGQVIHASDSINTVGCK